MQESPYQSIGFRLRSKYPTTIPVIVDVSGLYNDPISDSKLLIRGDDNLILSIRRYLHRQEQVPDRNLSILARGPTVLAPSLTAIDVWNLRRDPRDDVLYIKAYSENVFG